MSTIGTTINHGITIGAPYTSPLTITNTGAVNNQGTGNAVQGIGNSYSVVNQGSITATGSGNDGIYLNGNAIGVNNSGRITAAAQGLAMYGYATVTNTGTVFAGHWGLITRAASTIDNAGTIAGASQGVVLFSQGGVTTFTNSGLILGADGVGGNYGAITLGNTGTINGTYGTGVRFDQGGSVTNSAGGLISSAGGYEAVYIDLGAGNVVNDGTIMGNVGVKFAGSTNDTVIDTGTIIGTGGVYGDPGTVAIRFDSGNDVLKFNPSTSAFIQGTVDGGGGLNVLEFASAATAGTLTGSSAVFANFSLGTVDAGANWTLAGTNTFGAIVTLTNAATLTNSGDLTNAGRITSASGTALKVAAGGVVTNASGGAIAGSAFGLSATGAATIINNASIGASGGSGYAITLAAGGSVGNAGVISGTNYGVRAGGAAATVTNSGTITGSSLTGVRLDNGGTVVNSGSIHGSIVGVYVTGGVVQDTAGTISGATGIDLKNGGSASIGGAAVVSASANGIYAGAFSTVTNAGYIASGAGGVMMGAGGIVFNTGSIVASTDGIFAGSVAIVTNYGVIASSLGTAIYLNAGGTVTDGGTITRGVFMGGTAGANNLLVLTHGYALTGGVTASSTTSNTLELLGTSSAAPVIVNYNSLALTHFSTVAFATGAPNYATLEISNNAAVPETIAGFTNHETIDLTNFAFTLGATAIISGTSLVVTSGGVQETLSLTGIAGGTQFIVTQDAGTGSAVTLCFCAGTLIRTPGGEVRVEHLAVGDVVTTLGGGGARTVRWIGEGKILATRGQRGPATPVIVSRHALGPNVPCADLHITKAHALYLDDVLIPVEFLVNHRTIVWDDRAQEVMLYHVELDRHDVMIANGAPAESFRNDGNRWLFQNGHEIDDAVTEPPRFPVLTGGPVVDAAWRRLLDRAGPRALPPMTDDPDLHLVADGTRVDRVRQHGMTFLFHLDRWPERLRIVSRDVVPAELGLARDSRSLGVAIGAITVLQGARFVTLEANDPRLVEGFHAFEPEDELRWTNGDAAIPAGALGPFKGAVEVVLTLAGQTRYPDSGLSAGSEATRAA